MAIKMEPDANLTKNKYKLYKIFLNFVMQFTLLVDLNKD